MKATLEAARRAVTLSSLVAAGVACGCEGQHRGAPGRAPALTSPAPSPAPPAEHARRVARLAGGRTTTYDASCARDGDCAVAWVPLDCCGSQQAFGVRSGGRAALEQAGKEAMPSAACECLARATRLDSGQTTEDPAAIRVTCRAAVCSTSLGEAARGAPPAP